MLHHHASVLLDDDDIHVTNDIDAADGERVRLLIVGGGGNCFSFGTHFNRQLITLTIHSSRTSGAVSSADTVS